MKTIEVEVESLGNAIAQFQVPATLNELIQVAGEERVYNAVVKQVLYHSHLNKVRAAIEKADPKPTTGELQAWLVEKGLVSVNFQVTVRQGGGQTKVADKWVKLAAVFKERHPDRYARLLEELGSDAEIAKRIREKQMAVLKAQQEALKAALGDI
jgi:hypothetical protein